MPYIVIKANGQEIDRRELSGGIVIGRAPDCDVTLRDILLSRRHCRLETDGENWTLHDLQSKNGTIINAERLRGPWALQDNDVVRLGRSKIIFHAGLPDEDIADRILTPARPADPGDSLAGTLSGFTLLLPGEGENSPNMPCPQPRPKDPPAYGQEELQTLLSAIASSSWDSVYAEARQPLRSVEQAVCEDDSGTRRRVRPRSPMDLSLQANPAVPEAIEVMVHPEAETMDRVIKQKAWKKAVVRPNLHMTVATLWIVALVLLNIDHKSAAKRAMGDQTGPVTVAMPVVMAEDQSQTADFRKSGDDDLPESSESTAAEKVPATVKGIDLNGTTVRLVAEGGAFYFPLMAW